MSFVTIYVHVVFSTRSRKPLLTNDIRQTVIQHIKSNAIEKGIYIDCINGYTDHIHCLISLGKDQCMSDVVQKITGESSFWINKHKIIKQKFSWQDKYYAAGIGKSELKRIRNYIFNQELHHQKKSFNVEVDEFVNEYGWESINDAEITLKHP